MEELVPDLRDDLMLSTLALASQPLALQRRTILRWLQHHRVMDAGFEEVEGVRSLLDLESKAARVNLPGNRQARRRSGQISITAQSKQTPKESLKIPSELVEEL